MRRIVESFLSIQGEGTSVGRIAYFIRFAGCSLQCSWCDSTFASRVHEWKEKSRPLDIMALDIPEQCDRVILTGGEPLLQPLESIIKEIKDAYPHVQYIEVESNSIHQASEELLLLVSQWNLSPKLRGTQVEGVDESILTQGLEFWSKVSLSDCVSFKFVVGSEEQLNEVVEIVNKYNLSRDTVFLMREGVERKRFVDDEFNFWLIEKCKELGFNYSPRLHILIWNKTTGV